MTKSKGITDTVHYFLVNPFIPDLLELFKKDYHEILPRPACCPVTKKGVYPGERRK
jgi:hypothetical protein